VSNSATSTKDRGARDFSPTSAFEDNIDHSGESNADAHASPQGVKFPFDIMEETDGQWRFDAGLNADHQLVQSGAYRVVRHPIYTSMLSLMLGTGFLITPMPVLLLATVLFVIGTEIRVRIEDALLASRFGEAFQEYKRRVPAYIPFVN
jgi:steroid 5-alpha reductase family enzyme